MNIQRAVLWNILTPITILSIITNIIPFIIHIRLRNWPATYMSLLFVVYGLLTFTNLCINQTVPIDHILNLTQNYWFCWIYDIGTSAIKVSCTGCYLRLLNRLLQLLQKIATQQQQHQNQQQYTYLPDVSTQFSTNVVITSIRHFLSAKLPTSDDFKAANTRRRRQQPWKIKLSQARNSLALSYQDHHLLLWDIMLIWISPIIYVALCTSIDTHYDANEYFDASLRYIYYSPTMGCLNRNTSGFTASTIYYVYPILLMCGGFLYTGLIAIKIKQLKLYFKGKPAEYGLNRLPFYRLFIFCCLYNLLYVLHLPFILPNYLAVVLHQQMPMSEHNMYLSKNGLIVKKGQAIEMLLVAVYPVLSFFWSLFFGTSQEAYSIYKSIWHWMKSCSSAWRGKQQTMSVDNEKLNDSADQLQPDIETQQLLPSPPEIYLGLNTTVSSRSSTLISPSFSHPILSPKTPSSPDSDRSSYVTAKQRSWLLSLSPTSTIYGNYNLSSNYTDRRAFFSIPCFPSRDTFLTNHSAHSIIDIDPTIATRSSVTLVNHRSY